MKTRTLFVLMTALAAASASFLFAQSKPAKVQKPKATFKIPAAKATVEIAAPKKEVPPPKVEGSENLPVIGHLETRHRFITIKAGPNGAVYTVKTKAGKILATDATLDQLKAQLPDVHDFLKSSVAGKSGRSGAVMDASVGP